jgi:hypothetical protein
MSLREVAATPHPPATRQQIDTVRGTIPEDVRAVEAPSSSAMGRSYRNYVARSRNELGDDLLDHQDPLQILIPQRLHDCLLHDGLVDGQRIIIFMSQFGREMLQNHGANVSIDGTFKVYLCVRNWDLSIIFY